MKKTVKAVGLAVGVAVLALPGTAQAAERQPWSEFINVGLSAGPGPDACVDAAAGNNTRVGDCDGTPSQRWKLENLGEETGEYGVFRIRKNEGECAELDGTWAGATLRLRPCDAGERQQRFRVTKAEGPGWTVHLHNADQQLLKAYHPGEAPFTSATLEWPGDNAIWRFRPLG